MVVVAVVSACGAADVAPARTTSPPPTFDPPTTSSSVSPTSRSTVVDSTEPSAATSTTAAPIPVLDPTFVVFMPRGLPDDFESRAAPIEGVESIALRLTETLHIVQTHDAAGSVVDQPPAGFVIPIQGAAVVASSYVSFAEAPVVQLLEELAADQVLLSESSARLRRIGAGGRITFADGRQVTVLAVVLDTAFGAEEIVTTDPDLVGGPGSELRFALISFAGTADELRQALTLALPDGSGIGVHTRGRLHDQTTAVRSQVWIKQTFGEFSYKPTGNGRFTIDPAWVAANIVTVEIPLLGTTRCHRIYADLLIGVMEALIASGDADAIDRSAFHGCWNARYVSNSSRLSRHAWGAAADINFFNSLDGGPGSPVSGALLEQMAMAGITSGHDWSIPDPGHFEYYGFPQDE